MEILFLQVGGTVDKAYPPGSEDHGYAFQIGEPAFISILRRAKVAFKWSYRTVMKKDSLDMTHTDRAEILSEVSSSSQDRIIITHGTDTIGQTAEALRTVSSKVVILTGAMLPEKFRDTDADFNLGTAIGAVQFFSPGVYVALSGVVTTWDKYQASIACD